MVQNVKCSSNIQCVLNTVSNMADEYYIRFQERHITCCHWLEQPKELLSFFLVGLKRVKVVVVQENSTSLQLYNLQRDSFKWWSPLNSPDLCSTHVRTGTFYVQQKIGSEVEYYVEIHLARTSGNPSDNYPLPPPPQKKQIKIFQELLCWKLPDVKTNSGSDTKLPSLSLVSGGTFCHIDRQITSELTQFFHNWNSKRKFSQIRVLLIARFIPVFTNVKDLVF